VCNSVLSGIFSIDWIGLYIASHLLFFSKGSKRLTKSRHIQNILGKINAGFGRMVGMSSHRWVTEPQD
jgi:hypothetical protein